jgi:hypothetical protein
MKLASNAVITYANRETYVVVIAGVRSARITADQVCNVGELLDRLQHWTTG